MFLDIFSGAGIKVVNILLDIRNKKKILQQKLFQWSIFLLKRFNELSNTD
jgi:hypothetical protein